MSLRDRLIRLGVAFAVVGLISSQIPLSTGVARASSAAQTDGTTNDDDDNKVAWWWYAGGALVGIFIVDNQLGNTGSTQLGGEVCP